MRIGIVSPLFESVPPVQYGATERVISYLCDGLSQKGCDVTLFASGDSTANARLIPVIPERLWQSPEIDKDTDFYVAPHYHLFHEVQQRSNDFDIIHFHTNFLHFPFVRKLKGNHVTTIHFRLDKQNLKRAYWPYQEYPLISISNSQRRPLPAANWIKTVYHGIPKELHRRGEGAGGYAAFLGRMSPNKGPDKAIEIALKAGLKIKLAAKINEWDLPFFESSVRPYLDHPDVEYLGMVDDAQKQELLANAECLLFPISWPEPFGLVMIEALSCGTPVVAFRQGSVPEILEDGKTGYITDDVEQAVDAMNKLHLLSRETCRKEFEKRFSSEVMAENHLEAYSFLVDEALRKRTGAQLPGSASNKRPRSIKKVAVSPRGGQIVQLDKDRFN